MVKFILYGPAKPHTIFDEKTWPVPRWRVNHNWPLQDPNNGWALDDRKCNVCGKVDGKMGEWWAVPLSAFEDLKKT